MPRIIFSALVVLCATLLKSDSELLFGHFAFHDKAYNPIFGIGAYCDCFGKTPWQQTFAIVCNVYTTLITGFDGVFGK